MQLKRVYEPVAATDGMRILVDRVWPRGIRREALKLDLWAKDAAPSAALRKWFNHEPARWKEFQQRYVTELDRDAAAWHPIRDAVRRGKVTLLYAARDTEHNNAVALSLYLGSARADRASAAGHPPPEEP